jgi:hypothetical protein
VASLRQQYGLTDQYLRALLTHERHKRIVSPKPFYRALRNQAAVRPGQTPRMDQENSTEIRAP